MKKPQMIVLLAVLLLGLLIPFVYQGRAGVPLKWQPGQQFEGVNSQAQDSGSKRTAFSGNPAQAGEKGADDPGQQKESETGLSNERDVPQEADPENTEDKQKSSETITVSVAAVGKNGDLLCGPADVKLSADREHGLTALGVLDASGLNYVMSTRFPDLVISIAGQKNEGQSGWMFNVNNEYVNVAAGQKTVVNGDRIIWYYSNSLDAPPPDWEKLLKLK